MYVYILGWYRSSPFHADDKAGIVVEVDMDQPIDERGDTQAFMRYNSHESMSLIQTRTFQYDETSFLQWAPDLSVMVDSEPSVTLVLAEVSCVSM